MGVPQKFLGVCFPVCKTAAQAANDKKFRKKHEVSDDRDTLALHWSRFTKRDAFYEARATPKTRVYEGPLGVVKTVLGAIIYPEAHPELQTRIMDRYREYMFTHKLEPKQLAGLQASQFITLVVTFLRRKGADQLAKPPPKCPPRNTTGYELRPRKQTPTKQELEDQILHRPGVFWTKTEEVPLSVFLEYTVIGHPPICPGFARKVVEVLGKMEDGMLKQKIVEYVSQSMIPVDLARDVRGAVCPYCTLCAWGRRCPFSAACATCRPPTASRTLATRCRWRAWASATCAWW